MVLSLMLGDPEETLCGWICSAFFMTQLTTPRYPGMPHSAQLPYPNTKLPSSHLTPSWINDSYTVLCTSNSNLSVLCLLYTVKFRK